MTDLKHILRRAARRELFGRAVRRAGFGLAIALAAALLLLLADRLLGLSLAPGLYGTIALAGAVGGIATAVATGSNRFAAAVHLDRRFDLRDRLGSAAALEEAPAKGQDRAFVSLVRHDADRLAGRLDVRAATPIRITGIWGAVVAIGIALLLAGMLLPSMDRSRRDEGATEDRVALQQERAELAESIAQTAEEIRQDTALDHETRQDLDALQQLAEQLTGDSAAELDPDAARKESARRLNEVADRLAREAEREAAAAEELSRRFVGMQTPEAPMSAEEFTEALRRGEFGDAADLLEQLINQAPTLPESDRRALAEHLAEISRQAEQAGELPDREREERRARLEQALRDQGIDEQTIERLTGTQSRQGQPLEQEFDERDIDPELAQDFSRELEWLREEQAVDERAERDARDIAEALRDAADRLEPPAPEQDRSPPQPVPQQPETRPPREGPDRPEAEPPPPRPDPAQAPPREATPQGQRRRQPEPDGEQPAEPRAAETPDRRPESGEERQPQPAPDQPGAQPQQQQQPAPDQPGAQPQQQQQPTPDQPGAQPQQQQPAAQPTPHGGEPGAPPEQPAVTEPDTPKQAIGEGDAPEGPSPGSEELVEPGRRPPPDAEGISQPGDAEAGDGRERPSPAEQLREMERRRQAAQERRETAQRARETAQKMAENMSEQERQQWMEHWRRTGADGIGNEATRTAPRTDAPPFDDARRDAWQLSGEDPAGRIVAEWLTDERTGPAEGVSGSGRGAETLRQARRAAERAVDETAVPSRYHELIKRYFGRLRETVDSAARQRASSSGESSDATATDDADS